MTHKYIAHSVALNLSLSSRNLHVVWLIAPWRNLDSCFTIFCYISCQSSGIGHHGTNNPVFWAKVWSAALLRWDGMFNCSNIQIAQTKNCLKLITMVLLYNAHLCGRWPPMYFLSLCHFYLQYSWCEKYFVFYKVLTSCWTEGGRRQGKERAGLLTHWKPRPPTLQENLVSKFVLRRSMFHKSLVDKEMLTRYLWLPPSWIEIILVTAVQLMPTSNERPSFPCSSTFPPTSS